MLEKIVVRSYFYPIFTNPEINSALNDQYAFRPSGSTTSALIALTPGILDMLHNEPYVRLISLDFSRAFDTVRHSYLSEQLALLPLPDFLYNWILSLLQNRQHCTKFLGQVSAFCRINASIIQGSGLGPSDFVVAISGLKPVHCSNRLLKYADDSYILIPASAITSTSSELQNVANWAQTCNLKLNNNKSKEMIFRRPRSKLLNLPPPIPGIGRVSESVILGVTISDRLSFDPHIDRICIKASQSLYAIRILIAHGLSGTRLFDVVRATSLARLLYASPAWYGFAKAGQRARINAIIRKMVRLKFLPADQKMFDDLCGHADSSLFSSVLHNPSHVLNCLLPPIKNVTYSLRPRSHNREIPHADALTRCGFITRMLFN